MPTHTKSIHWWVESCLADKGYAEQPLGSNNTKFGRKFGFNRVAWCVIYGYLKYLAAGVVLPLKTASCVQMYDECVRRGLRYRGGKAVTGDSVIRTWQRLKRNSPGFDAEQTHFQEVIGVKRRLGIKYLVLWGGNQGAGYVGPVTELVRAGDSSILGALAFHTLFDTAQPVEPVHDPKADQGKLPAAKSHPASPKPTKPKPGVPKAPKYAPRWFRGWWGRFSHWYHCKHRR